MGIEATIKDIEELGSFGKSLVKKGYVYHCIVTGKLESGELGCADDWLTEPTLEVANAGTRGCFTEIVEVEVKKDYSRVAGLL